ncbi:MAG: TorF family putative porin [Gammaproteobacteria bacterium]
MKLIRGGLAFIGLLGVAGATQAGVTSTWTATNDYDFRGNSQSAKDPAIQGSIDYAADAGWYVGAWASNIDFGVPSGGPLDNPDVELDVYGGYTKTLESGYTYDFGVVAYTYPQETDFTYEEVYASIAKGWFKAKIWYSPEFGGKAAKDLSRDLGNGSSVSAWYGQVDATIPLPANFSVGLHAGYSTGDYWDNAFGDDQFDWSAGVGYTAGNFALNLKYVDTSGDVKVTSDAFNNEGRVIFTVATTFPWK